MIRLDDAIIAATDTVDSLTSALIESGMSFGFSKPSDEERDKLKCTMVEMLTVKLSLCEAKSDFEIPPYSKLLHVIRTAVYRGAEKQLESTRQLISKATNKDYPKPKQSTVNMVAALMLVEVIKAIRTIDYPRDC